MCVGGISGSGLGCVCVCVQSAMGVGSRRFHSVLLLGLSLTGFLPVFTCSSVPVIISMSEPASVSTTCNECPSQFSTDMGSCTAGKNNQLVLHGGRPHGNTKHGLNGCCRDGC